MKLRNLRVEKSPRIMIIPMIDIIFFLLVFFMMSTLYMNDQKVVPVNLPSAATAGKQAPEKPITLVLAADQKIFLNKQEISPENLPAAVGRQLTQYPDAPFILRADKQVDYGSVVALLDKLKQLGVKKVAFATEGNTK